MKPLLLFTISLSFLFSAIKAQNNFDNYQGQSITTSNISTEEVEQLLETNGMRFTPNKGQIADSDGNLQPDILYYGETQSTAIYLRKTGISYVQSDMNEVMHKINGQLEELIQVGVLAETDKQSKQDELLQKEKINIHRVDMDFAGANTHCQLVNEDELQGFNNYYYAHCPNGILNVKQYNKVTYKNIYKGIDITYYASPERSRRGNKEQGLKYNLIVQPHADPNQIKIHWKGAKEIKLDGSKLKVESSLSTMTETLPKVYQNINGKIVDVECRYKLEEVRSSKLEVRSKYGTRLIPNTSYLVTFELETYNLELPLIIDPYWATYYGGAGDDYGQSVATDNAGNVYLAGRTNSTNAIATTAGIVGHQTVYGGNADAFLVKFNASTGTRLWGTYYGGTFSDGGGSVATDNAGNVYLAGSTSSTIAIASTTGIVGHQTAFGGGRYDAFLVKFDTSTGIRLWGTYYGGASDDYGGSVATDNASNVYLAGSTSSSNAIATTTGIVGHQTAFGGGEDAFLVKFNASTGNRLWGTYYGGVREDIGYDVATDKTDNVYMAGVTASPASIASTVGTVGHQTIHGGGGMFLVYDAFLVKFNASTGNRLWGTYYGGTDDDFGYNVATDNVGSVYLAGYTNSKNAIASTTGTIGYQTIYGGGWYDVFLVKFNASTGTRLWGTYYGGIESEITTTGGCLTIDGNNNVYFLIDVEDSPGPNLDACSYQPKYAGGHEDQLIVKFNPAGKKICATYFGGTGYEDLELGGGIAIADNQLFLTTTNGKFSYTGYGGYPVTPGVHQTVPGGNNDAVLAALCINICEGKTLALGFSASNISPCTNDLITFTPAIANSCDTTGYKYNWTFTGGNPASSTEAKPTVSFFAVGTHDVKLVVTTLCKKDSVTKTNYITVTQCTTCTLAGQFTKGTSACSNCGCKEWLMVNATGGTPPYTYQWPDGYDKRYKNKVCPGNYTIKITDKNGCSVNVSITAP